MKLLEDFHLGLQRSNKTSISYEEIKLNPYTVRMMTCIGGTMTDVVNPKFSERRLLQCHPDNYRSNKSYPEIKQTSPCWQGGN